MSSMMPPEIGAAMGGGAPPAPGGGGGLPPDLASLLGGGGPAAGSPEASAPASVTDGTHGGGQEALVAAIDAIQDAIDAEADQEDIQVMLACQSKLQSILAKDQKAADSAMGGSLPPGAARKMAGGLGG
jgi:hypothetical protein